MKGRLNGDGEDTSEQLTPKQIRGYAEFRKAKGQVEYNNGSILTTDRMPLDELLRRGMIDDSQHWAGEVITRIHEAAFMFLGYRRMRELIAEITGCEVRSDLGPMDIFVHVMRALKPYQKNIISRVCWGTIGENDYGWLYHCRASVQESFDTVQDALGELLNKKSVDNPEQVDKV